MWDISLAHVLSKKFLIVSKDLCSGYWFFLKAKKDRYGQASPSTAIVWLFVKLSFFFVYLQLFRPMIWLRYCPYFGALVNIIFYMAIVARKRHEPARSLSDQVDHPNCITQLGPQSLYLSAANRRYLES